MSVLNNTVYVFIQFKQFSDSFVSVKNVGFKLKATYKTIELFHYLFMLYFKPINEI